MSWNFSFSLTILISVVSLSKFQSSCAQNFSQDCLTPHNTARAEVRVPPLTWSTTLENYARDYANKRIGDCSLVHSNGRYGENLAWSSGELSCSAAVRLWVAEKAYYNYNSNSCAAGRVCGHYTQVVWRNTVNVGCARVRCNNNKGTFVICSYSPPGNYVGQRPY